MVGATNVHPASPAPRPHIRSQLILAAVRGTSSPLVLNVHVLPSSSLMPLRPRRLDTTTLLPRGDGADLFRKPRSSIAPRATMAFSILASLLFVCYAYARAVPHPHIPFRDTSACLNVTRDVQQSWSMYSPYFPAADYVAPPASCQINQVCATSSRSAFERGSLQRGILAQTVSLVYVVPYGNIRSRDTPLTP